ncbi:hypothetical protein M426DRAFT_267833 [Hypoxylon sp. CI-4A]|nr:hypothetical protein M426DRAFT_267833 [Hypoxylon sp. CI-4A]
MKEIQDIPPPPYTERDSTAAPSLLSQYTAKADYADEVSKGIPQTIYGYYPNDVHPYSFQLGEHAGGNSLYTVSINRYTLHGEGFVMLPGWGGQGHAVVAVDRPTSYVPNSDGAIEVYTRLNENTRTRNGDRYVHMSQNQNLRTFTMEVGEGSKTRRETFEWKPTRGAEVQELDGNMKGYKLVRSSATGIGGGAKGSKKRKSGMDDEKEVVAVWTTIGDKRSLKPFKFRLLGSGVTGELGDRFALVALSTGVQIWLTEYKGLNKNFDASSPWGY